VSVFTKPVPKPERQTPQKEWQDKAIAVACKIVLLDARCAKCNRPDSPSMALHPHHIVHRKYGNTCTLKENLIPLCVGCHAEAHSNENAFKAWIEKRSPGLYDRLWQLARAICMLDFEDVYEQLLIEYKEKLEEKAKRDGLH